MGRVFVIELEGPVYTCKKCHTHLALPSDIISKVIDVFSQMVVTNMSSLDSSIHFWLKERSKISFVSFVSMRSAFNYGVTDPNSYWVMRGELHGPEGSDDEI
ncbi:hypothetical protein HID58_049306 [Brassica napus]|uniref:Yippee domain-containing protein n=1 Tax=Brassica napus TaxID=3708 RepID=A0ABQ8B4J7_BRANA|nr:hypothetical protein HID58_049302 [Brassica napus]KAH0899738.1 hypothetical protein HID58_049306 [Brassica napus]